MSEFLIYLNLNLSLFKQISALVKSESQHATFCDSNKNPEATKCLLKQLSICSLSDMLVESIFIHEGKLEMFLLPVINFMFCQNLFGLLALRVEFAMK